jgi:hypothetical protein
MKDADRRYPLTWHMQVEEPPLSHAECEAADRGGSDAAIIFSIVYPESGTYRLTIVSLDGRTGETVPDEELFSAWAILAAHLQESTTLSPGKRELAQTVHEYVRQVVMMGRDVERDPSL